MKDYKSRILDAIDSSSEEVNEDNLSQIEKIFQDSIDVILKNGTQQFPIQNINFDKKIGQTSNSLFSFLGNNELNPRVIVIGDIHCDYNSLAGIFRKLSISKYDYLNKATFVCVGDYIDRGLLPFQTLRLLFKLKEILGERCILLQGNHDHIKFSEEENKFYSEVTPAETVELLNQYLSIETRKRLRDFFDRLPYLYTLTRNDKRILVVHAGIPRDEYIDFFNIENIKEFRISEQNDKNNLTSKMLTSMLWGDPSIVEYKKNGMSTRFEFGETQFNKFINLSGFTHIIRGHEPIEFGYKEIYSKKLLTVFSSGGMFNEHSYYDNSVPYPSFLIIDEKGNIIPENIHLYKINFRLNKTDNTKIENNNILFINEKISPFSFLIETDFNNLVNQDFDKNILNNLHLNSEFTIDINSSNIPFFLWNKFKDIFTDMNSKREIN